MKNNLKSAGKWGRIRVPFPGRNSAAILFLLSATHCNAPQKNTSTGTSVDRFAEHVRSTEYQTPAKQQKGFRLPEGFEINLFASEPEIGKPMNIEFDDRGRLWITQSTEYPMAAQEGIGKDKIMILEDTNGDGRADKFTEFKTGLNIPIGILPMSDGAIAYSIPNVYYFRDLDGDGKADSTQKLLGPFGYADTHGMINNFVRGYDGWVHSSHGFANTSKVAGRDGDSLYMYSGNTFRFRIDGSRAEQTTYGRVNPFGFAYDERGYLYSVDCHSKPLYQLIPGADYPHFGKKPTGIGFGPEMTRYELGSTALSGLVYYTGHHFPEKYRKNFFIGDVVTSRISRNSATFVGSTPVLKFEEDFLVSDDPWFRPVDIKMGPDGAIYVADFYNRIIGHYEVDLQHPGRDRTSGRIWRITYKGGPVPVSTRKDLGASTLNELIGHLNEPQIPLRMRVANLIADKFGKTAVAGLTRMAEDNQMQVEARVQALWLLNRLESLPVSLIDTFLNSTEENLRIHALRILRERRELADSRRGPVIDALADKSPFVKRTAAEVLGVIAHSDNLQPLIKLYQSTAEEDSHLKYTVLLAIRQNLEKTSVAAKLANIAWSESEKKVLCKAAIDIPDCTLANFVITFLLETKEKGAEYELGLAYVATLVSPGQVEQLAMRSVRGLPTDDPGYLKRLELLASGIMSSGRAVPSALADMSKRAAADVVRKFARRATQDGEKLEESNQELLALAMNLVGRYKVREVDSYLLSYLEPGSPAQLQAAAVSGLTGISAEAYLPVFKELFASPATSNKFKENLVNAIAVGSHPENLTHLRKQLPGASRGLQIEIFTALLRSDRGVQELIEVLEKEEARMDLLQVGRVKSLIVERMKVSPDPRMEALLKRSEDSIREFNDLLASREAGALKFKGSAEKGRSVFMTNCSSCHQIKGVGGMIGPQLDGIGNWGVKALTEKILVPNRNITEAFKTYQINLKSGESKLGLFRREEGNRMIFADHAGAEFSVFRDQIDDFFPLI